MIFWVIIIWAKATFFFEQLFPVVARTWWALRSDSFFLGPKSRFLVQKSYFCHTTPILVNGLFVAPGETVTLVFVMKHSRRWEPPIWPSKMFGLFLQQGISVLNQHFCNISLSCQWKWLRDPKIAPGKLKTCQKTFLHLLPTSLTNYSQCTVNFGGR